MNAKFLNRDYPLTPEQERHHSQLQEFISSGRAGLFNRTRYMDEYWRKVEKSVFHNDMRKHIKLLPPDSRQFTEVELAQESH